MLLQVIATNLRNIYEETSTRICRRILPCYLAVEVEGII